MAIIFLLRVKRGLALLPIEEYRRDLQNGWGIFGKSMKMGEIEAENFCHRVFWAGFEGVILTVQEETWHAKMPGCQPVNG
jgi:hypothetical protein